MLKSAQFFIAPTKSALYLACEAVSSREISVTWAHAPPAYIEGVRVKYTINYEGRGQKFTDTLPPDATHYDMLFLKAYAEYRMYITAHTKMGPGVKTETITCKTEESGMVHCIQRNKILVLNERFKLF